MQYSGTPITGVLQAHSVLRTRLSRLHCDSFIKFCQPMLLSASENGKLSIKLNHNSDASLIITVE